MERESGQFAGGPTRNDFNAIEQQISIEWGDKVHQEHLHSAVHHHGMLVQAP